MKKQQSGFTLIELIAVLVILGILSAVAVPKFVDLSAEAEAAALEGVVGSVESGSALNYAACAANSTTECTAITAATTCSDAVAAAVESLDSDYTVGGTTVGGADCTVGGAAVTLLVTP